MERHIKFSENEEMYLVVIAKLNERDGGGPVALAKVAHELAILPVSANQMVRKLEKIGLVSYAPYKGVELTESGSLIASRILRQRRLWEVFLVEHLYLMSTEAEELTCRLEHIFPEAEVERLAEFLGNPRVSPTGKLIPHPLSTIAPRVEGIRLPGLRVGGCGAVLYIEAQDSAKDFLQTEGFVKGAELCVEAVGAEGAMLVVLHPKRAVYISSSVARTVWVRPATD
jgi:DtxR family Mn-dependent transcriptional regulator